MNDKNAVAGFTAIAIVLYFIPNEILKFVGIAILLLFSPGFFVLKLIYRDMKGEELFLLSFGVSVGISGTIALILSLISVLSPANMFIAIGAVIIVGYALSSAMDIKPFKLTRPDKFSAVLISLMLVLITVWISVEANTHYYREVDIGILSWPDNATANSTLNFTVYIKNQNYGHANITLKFSLNKVMVNEKNLSLENGEKYIMNFTAFSEKHGENLASFDMYVNGKYYTNVHVYFYLH